MEKEMKAKTAGETKPNRRVGAPSGPRRADEKRATLIEAARTLFMEKGYDVTTMDDISGAANVAKGTLYHYFSTKSDLLLALREDFDRAITDRIRAHVERCPADDWPCRISAWIDAAVDAYFDMTDLHDVVIYGSGMPFRNAMADAGVTQYLSELVQAGNDADAWKVDDVHWTAIVMFYAYRGGCDEAIVGNVPAATVSKKLNELFQRILRYR